MIKEFTSVLVNFSSLNLFLCVSSSSFVWNIIISCQISTDMRKEEICNKVYDYEREKTILILLLWGYEESEFNVKTNGI